MDWLMDWLRQLVMIVLTAVLLDLFLPSTSSQRYVRMVMGLLIIAVMLQPLWKIKDIPLDSLLSSSSTDTSQMASISDIKAAAAKITQSEQTQIDQKLQDQISTMIKQEIEQSLPVTVQHVQVSVTPTQSASGSSKKPPRIQKLVITVSKQKNSEIQSVREVQIHVQREPPTPADQGSAPVTEEQKQWTQQIRSMVAASFQLPDRDIEVNWMQS